MNEKQVAMNPPFRVSNIRTGATVFFAVFMLVFFGLFLVALLRSDTPTPKTVMTGVWVTVVSAYLSIMYIYCMYFAVFTFHESHFELHCPLRPFWRKASYPYQAVRELYFHNTGYSNVAVFFRKEKKRRHIWSIFADLAGDEKNMENLTAFLRTKGVEVTSFY